MIIAAFLLVVAIAGKVAAGWLYASKEPTNRLVVGLGMMPRGEVGLIFLGLGASQVAQPITGSGDSVDGDRHHLPGPLLLRFVLGHKEERLKPLSNAMQPW